MTALAIVLHHELAVRLLDRNGLDGDPGVAEAMAASIEIQTEVVPIV